MQMHPYRLRRVNDYVDENQLIQHLWKNIEGSRDDKVCVNFPLNSHPFVDFILHFKESNGDLCVTVKWLHRSGVTTNCRV